MDEEETVSLGQENMNGEERNGGDLTTGNSVVGQTTYESNRSNVSVDNESSSLEADSSQPPAAEAPTSTDDVQEANDGKEDERDSINSNENTLPESTAEPPPAESTIEGETNNTAQSVQDASEGEKSKPPQEVTTSDDANVAEESGSVGEDGIKKGESESGKKKEDTTQSEDGEKKEDTTQSKNVEKVEETTQSKNVEKVEETTQSKNGEKVEETSQSESGEKIEETAQSESGEKIEKTTQNEGEVSQIHPTEQAVLDSNEGDDPEEPEQVFEYDYNSMKSRPEMVSVTTENMLELFHSYGFECQKRSNLVVLSKETVAYAAGNLVVLFNLTTHMQSLFRSLGGGGIGAITVHPSLSYLAIGEKGTKPVIAIYTFPELNLHRVLRGGTEEMYSHMDFSPGDGKLLASIGGNPDYMLTVWNWERESIVLRSKAFSQDIYRVSFSPENPGQLTTSGTGHIRFWKMATTFTGLKLQGYLGKFGRVEISDISAYVELPDGKVLSGTEWGNLLLWDGGFIKVEISKKGKKVCHHGMIETIYLDEGELISAGVDGYVRVWDFETIDNADITDESVVFEMDPLIEIKVGNDVSIKSLARSVDPDTPTLWFAQDANGAIWKIDIVVSHTRKAPEKLMSYHSGKITGLNCSPIDHQAATISENGSVRIYDLPTKQVVCHSQFSCGGSSLIWAPTTIDPSATTLITGYQDGVLRVLRLEEKVRHHSGRSRKEKYYLNLVHACKPHTQAISCLAVDQEGNIIASGSKDSTVFFLSAEDNYEPIGFVSTPSPVVTVQWSSKSQSDHRFYLLVCCEDGSMLEIDAPEKGKYDISKTYYLDPLKYTAKKFISIKDRLRAEEEEARQKAEREVKQREKEVRKQKRKELLGDDYISEDEEEEEVEEESGETGEEQPATELVEKIKEPGLILTTFYGQSQSKGSDFWVSMSGNDVGYLYQCSMEDASTQEPEPYESPHAIPIPPVSGEDVPLHSLTFNSTGEYLLTGTSNGMIRIHPLSTPYSLSALDSYWALSMHDNHYGAVSHLTTTFDDQYVVSGGADGNVFVYQTNLPTIAQREMDEVQKVEIPTESGKFADDIEDPEHYSIEDAKQKAELDRVIKLAEEKKQLVRRQIASLRRSFNKLHQRDKQLPEHLRLDSREFVMDPDMEQQLKKQAEEKIELVRKEMIWECEKSAVALKKLKTKYKDIVSCDLVTVWTFTGKEHVSSFRSAVPSEIFLKLMEKILETDTSVPTPFTTSDSNSGRRKSKSYIVSDRHSSLTAPKEVAIREIDQPEKDSDMKISKQETRRLTKERRKLEWEELYEEKPDDNFDDAEEVKSIEQAKKNMGDYKLKTANDYVVPQDQRVTTESKRKQLVLLRKQIFDGKREYNTKLIDLRDWKLQIIEKISNLISELERLQSKLPHRLHKPLPPVPKIHPEEVPERKTKYTKESLLIFKAQIKARQEAERQAAAAGGDGGFFGGFGDEGGDDGENGGSEEGSKEVNSSDVIKEETQMKQTIKEEEESDDISRPGSQVEKIKEVELTPLQAIKQKEEKIRHIYERDCLLAEIVKLKEDFDETLLRLRHEKAYLDITMVIADLKHITQFEELQLLKEFEKKETSFTSRYRTKKNEKEEVEGKIEESQWSLSEKEEKLNWLVEQEKALGQSFLQAIGDNNKFKDFLLKVFRKKIKRAKKKVEESKKEGAEGDEAEEESDDDSESDYTSSSDEESQAEGELDDSLCPAGCDQGLYSQATVLREKRLDLEESIAEEKKSLDTMRKELESMKKKAKSMGTHVKSALNDLQAFQLKKQQRLNELDQVAVLTLNQLLHYQPDGEPPTSISSCLVFPASSLQKLGQRIGELSSEKQQEKKRYKELKQKHVRLVREKKEMLVKIAELNARANEAMILKFGRIVDLDRLEGLGVNHIVEGLKSKLRAMDLKTSKQLAAISAQIDAENKRLAMVTRENTKMSDRRLTLYTSKESLEAHLNMRQKSMSKDVTRGDDGEEAREERAKLLHIVKIQVGEVQALKEEIILLQCKGGHILPPTQPPVHP